MLGWLLEDNTRWKVGGEIDEQGLLSEGWVRIDQNHHKSGTWNLQHSALSLERVHQNSYGKGPEESKANTIYNSHSDFNPVLHRDRGHNRDLACNQHTDNSQMQPSLAAVAETLAERASEKCKKDDTETSTLQLGGIKIKIRVRVDILWMQL